jgi:hypothetical protein
MVRQSADKVARQRKPKPRKFYIITYSLAHKLADFAVENWVVLSPDGQGLRPPEGRRGFPIYPEKPRVVIGMRKEGPPPSDIELCHAYWLISDRLKSVFEAIDPQAFAFQACDVRVSDGSPGPVHWLCDVVRVLDAFGEPTLQVIEGRGLRYRGVRSIREDLVFNESIIEKSHVFRTRIGRQVFCDQIMKDACKGAGIKGIKFYNCFRR